MALKGFFEENPKTRTGIVIGGAGVLLVGGWLFGWGDDIPDPARSPERADRAEFCDAFTSVRSFDDGGDYRKYARNLAKVDTPESWSTRQGFEDFVNAMRRVDDKDTVEQVEAEVRDSERADIEDFMVRSAATCDVRLDRGDSWFG